MCELSLVSSSVCLSVDRCAVSLESSEHGAATPSSPTEEGLISLRVTEPLDLGKYENGGE